MREVRLWLLLLLALAVATRNPDVEPGPATGELAGQSPAVVDLITGGWRLRDEAVSATLLDLAARGVVAIEEIGPELSLVRLRGEPGGLRPYERLVYDHVRSLAVDGVVATGALAEGSRDLGRWWRSCRRKVIAEAREQGLSRARWSRAHALLLAVAAAVPAVAIGIAVSAGDSSRAGHDGGPGAAIVSFALLMALMGRLNGERGTAAGAAARRVLHVDRPAGGDRLRLVARRAPGARRPRRGRGGRRRAGRVRRVRPRLPGHRGGTDRPAAPLPGLRRRRRQVDVLVRDRRGTVARGQGHVPERADVAPAAGGRPGAGRGRPPPRLDRERRGDRGLPAAGLVRRHGRAPGGRAGEPRRGTHPAGPPGPYGAARMSQ
ncbi:MAG: DUF2207 domain-containing protein [Microbispora sp.]|nr:DUF2207 domain-containing protein [Microbispora sp.]